MKRKTLLLIPVLIISALLLYGWTILFTTAVAATWRHYLALLLYAGVVAVFVRNTGMAAIATGVFLLMATLNVINLTAKVSLFPIRIGPSATLLVQPVSLGILLLYVLLNYHTLAEIYLEYKEGRPIR